MQTEHYMFHVPGITPKSRAKICAQWGFFKPPAARAADRFNAVI